MDQEPGLNIFFQGLRYGQLRRPFDIITFIVGFDARLGDGQVFAVDFLDRLQFEETGTGHIASSDILGQLGVRAGSRAKGHFQRTVKDMISPFRVGLYVMVDAENRPCRRFCQDPVH